MPMSPRLLRPLASRSLVDSDAAAYLTAVQTADNQALEPAVRNAITAFVIGCKQDGIWDAIKASCILMGARTLSGALTPLVGSAPTNNGPFVTGDYNRETGLVGNGTTKYLNSNRNNNTDPETNHHQAVLVAEVGTGGVAAFIGAGNGAAGTTFIRRAGTGGVDNQFTSRNSTGDTVSGAGGSAGFFGQSRNSSANFSARAGGTTNLLTRTTNGSVSNSVHVFATFDGSVQRITNARIAFYSIGESLDLALLDTRVTALYNAIGAAI